MKRYHELSQTELEALTHEQVQTLVDLEVAHEGILPVPNPEPPTLEDVGLEKTVEAWRVGVDHYSYNSLLFVNEEDAKLVVAMSVVKTANDYSADDKYEWLEACPLRITPTKFYAEKDIAAVRSALRDNKERQKEYEKQKKEHDVFLKATADIKSTVWGVVHQARGFKMDVDHAHTVYKKHLTLADGDSNAAERFFASAYESKPDIIERVMEDLSACAGE